MTILNHAMQVVHSWLNQTLQQQGTRVLVHKQSSRFLLVRLVFSMQNPHQFGKFHNDNIYIYWWSDFCVVYLRDQGSSIYLLVLFKTPLWAIELYVRLNPHCNLVQSANEFPCNPCGARANLPLFVKKCETNPAKLIFFPSYI